MAKKESKPTFADFFDALLELTSVICGTVARGLFFGIGFWWAFYELMK